MRSLVCLSFLICLVAHAAPSPTAQKSSIASATPSLPAPKPRPQFRPAVLATGPDSLVNRIDSKGLLSKGQKDGAVQFGVTVSPDGKGVEVWTYNAMPGSDALEAEVLKKLEGSQFTPALYNHQPVAVLLYGTVVFDADLAPYVHIFLNQDPTELAAAHDFIGPQPVIGGDSGFLGLHMPENLALEVKGLVELQLTVSAQGSLGDLRVTGENPPMLGFRDSAQQDFERAKFIPAFRSGDPIESKTTMAVCYRPALFEMEAESQ